ncbi:hypothetical protein TRL7639_01104 [Falsiruegeria litorea R37]|uniref:DUF1150 domain-containing protein n=1 Tax=Falsiruegeria litorea R37 TaxID=1200284 RepID=A0A1Y5RYT5_9RHOB|nr:DUF1150 family protein [Falsiruegeria litorea]SLN28375.1 hypothetical protein TRL7639_01104 [Falsiruegeria litorea R37]
MDTPFDFNENAGRIVYVKTVDVADLPDQIRAEAGDHEQLYAVHDEEGQQLALVADRKLAFVLARQHDFAPVAVH